MNKLELFLCFPVYMNKKLIYKEVVCMRKYIALVLALVCVLGLCACNSNTSPNHGAAPEAYAFEAQYIRTNGYSEERSYPYHVVINSKEELDAYYEANKGLFDLERKDKVYSDTTIGFLDACDKYDATYFERQNLVLIVLEEGSGSIRHEITDVRNRWDENGHSLGWNITIDSIVPEVCTDDMAQWHLFLEVQMGDVIKSNDDVWINGKLSDSYANELMNTGTGSSIQVENPNNGTDNEVRVGIWDADFADGNSDNSISLSTDDAKALEEMLLSELWIDDLMDCVSDVTLTAADGRCLKYLSTDGIINDIDAHRCLVLNNVERETFNSLLEKYGTLGGNVVTDISEQSDKIMAPEYPITITANDESIIPYRHFLYSGSWDGNGFLCADGVDLLSKLPQLKTDGVIPQIHYSDDFKVLLEDSVTLQRILLYDGNFNQLDSLMNVSDLSMLDAGEYYVGFVVNWQGAYIEAAQQNEYIGWACTLKLIVDAS